MVSIYGVLEKWAGKEEAPGAPATTPTPAEVMRPDPSNIIRYYFYKAPKDQSIGFNNLNTNLERGDSTLLSLLQSGNQAGRGDYFSWSAIAVVVRGSDMAKTRVYMSDLSDIGKKLPGTQKMYPSTGDKNEDTSAAEAFEKEGDAGVIFETQQGISDMVHVEDKAPAYFYNQDPPQGIMQILATGKPIPGKPLSHGQFVEQVCSNYRLWLPTPVNGLRMPNFEESKTDELSDGRRGNYSGIDSQKAVPGSFTKEVLPFVQKATASPKPEEPNLKTKMETEEEEDTSLFQKGTIPVNPTLGKTVELGDSALAKSKNVRQAGEMTDEEIHDSALNIIAAITSTTVGESTLSTGRKPSKRTGDVELLFSNNPTTTRKVIQVAKKVEQRNREQEAKKEMRTTDRPETEKKPTEGDVPEDIKRDIETIRRRVKAETGNMCIGKENNPKKAPSTIANVNDDPRETAKKRLQLQRGLSTGLLGHS